MNYLENVTASVELWEPQFRIDADHRIIREWYPDWFRFAQTLAYYASLITLHACHHPVQYIVWLFTHLYCNPLSRLAKFWRITAILPQLLIRHIYLLHSTGRNIHPLVLAIFSNSCVWFIWVFLKRFCLLTHVWLCALHKYINFTKHFFCYILCTAINWEEPPTILHSPARRRHLPVLSSLRPSHLSPNEHLF